MRRHFSLDLVVGLFVIAGFLAFILLALKVSGLNDFSWRQEDYVVKANFSNIGGLKARSRVTVAGVTVGRVSEINLDLADNDYQATVVMTLKKELANKIPDDSVASIRTAGLIGDNYISITPGGSEEYLSAGDYIPETHSALVLENIISKFLYNKASDSDKSNQSSKSD